MENFINYISILNEKTQNNHIRNIQKIEDLMGRIDIDQNTFLNNLEKSDLNDSQKLTILSTYSKYNQSNMRNFDKIVIEIFETNNRLKKKYKTRNKLMKYNYTLKDINKEMNRFFDIGDYTSFIITYLITKYNVRNADVNVIISRHKKYTDDEHNWLVIRKNSILYIRNDFKTQKKYGSKIHEIKSTRFKKAVEYFMRDKDFLTRPLFDGFANSTLIIQQHLPFKLKQSDILKITLSEKNSLASSEKLGKNRGTSLDTLASNYNIIV